MRVSSQVAWEFDRYSITEGYRLNNACEIIVEPGPQSSLTATVDGQHVSLRLGGNQLEIGCGCRYYAKTRFCAHVFAALLSAEADGLIATPNAGRIYLARSPRFSTVAPQAGPSSSRVPVPKPVPPEPPPRRWLGRATELVRSASRSPRSQNHWPANRVIYYEVQIGDKNPSDLTLSVTYSDLRKNGKGLTKPKPLNLEHRHFDVIENETDRQILYRLSGTRDRAYYFSSSTGSTWSLSVWFARQMMPRICATGRCFIEGSAAAGQPPLTWESEPWRFSLDVNKGQNRYTVNAVLRRGDQTMPVSDPVLIVGTELLVTLTSLAPIESAAPAWVKDFRVHGPILAPLHEFEDLASSLMEANLPPEIMPEELRAEHVRVEPVPCLRIETRNLYYRSVEDVALLSFDYAGTIVPASDARRAIAQSGRKVLLRDLDAEGRAARRLEDFKLAHSTYDSTNPLGYVVPPQKLGNLVAQLNKDGWRIDFQGKKVVEASAMNLDVTSGIDWFDLHATVTFGEHKYTYPQLLKAIEAGGPAVILPSGEIAILPDEWVAEIGRLAALGKKEGNAFRFKLNQAGLLDVLLADRPEVRFDATFLKARDRLKAFDGIRPASQPAGFQGQLRDYQREGVGWIEFLRDFGFGGCLADDMGVGKTAQVLAALENRRIARRQEGSSVPPSIAVVPRSLVFNWKQEAARFTPGLRILDHTTPDRDTEKIAGHDLVLVTYGTLRRDIVQLREIKFDYAILDEAQAIKNAASDSAKAARLLNADHRLVLTGTPVQNSLNDLWSLFHFLNPGMLGASGALKSIGGSSASPDEKTRTLLSRALRPLILRRTKEQVASELPPKFESILHCEMEGDHRRLYEELRAHYRLSLLGSIDTRDMAKAKIMILEALLRLRQAACHPGLIDKKRVDEPSAKLDTLLARLSEVVAEGHKALVFSQFTSFLDIVRNRLDRDGVSYEYLDGATTNREAHVQNFQQNPDCRLFLISLKAGGVGLNLVAADYVFLLDPWWNPAVEAQAIDRTHRIGQMRHVFAYRLIAKDTVEEKVLTLQDSKRHLAEAVINQDNSVLAQIGREELEYLLS